MDYLSRNSSPVSEELWGKIDEATVRVARSVLTARKFLQLTGPLGPGAMAVPVDDAESRTEVAKDGFVTVQGRRFAEIPTLYEDFTLYAGDLASAGKTGMPVDLSAVYRAAQSMALKEDKLIFFGNARLGYEGLLTARGGGRASLSDWSAGENAFRDVAAAVETLVSKGVYGAYTLAVSPNLYLQMQRMQQALGVLEIDRVSKLVDGRLYRTPALGKDQALLLCAQPENMDLVIGQDLAAGYLEQRDLNHVFRLTESALVRIMNRKAVVALGKA